jgi:hypothetical protein
MRQIAATRTRRTFYMTTLAILVLSGCKSPCSDQVIQSITSPDGTEVATLTIANCGATTHFATAVSIYPAKKKRKVEDTVFSSQGRPAVRLSWSGNYTLAISCDTCSSNDWYVKVTQMQRSKGSYKIVYPWPSNESFRALPRHAAISAGGGRVRER